MNQPHTVGWIFFHVLVFILLFLDLKVFHRKAHAVHVKEALGWSAFWIFLALCFNAGVYYFLGRQAALEFLTGYLLEKSLSVDNLFVFLLIFSCFKVPAVYQHKTLFWGIIGALMMRAIFILTGVTLIHKFHWMIYLFGGFLVFTGIKLFFEKEKEFVPEKNLAIRLFRKLMPVTSIYHEAKFFIKEHGKLTATPLFVVLIVIETTDVIFAVDSIPAILSITTDPFIVYTSNIFAILGLRALYFALAGMMEMFHYLHYGLGTILVFVGGKMLAADYFHIPIGVSLAIIGAILLASIVFSLIFAKAKS